MNWQETLLAPLGILLGHSRKVTAQRTTRRYLQNVTRASCLADLSTALNPLLEGITEEIDDLFAHFATTDANSKSVWGRSNFTRFINAKLAGTPAVTACLPLLWRVFCSSAYYPFPEPIFASGGTTIDLDAFRRAFTLLVLHGFELFGARQNGSMISRNWIETKYTDKLPRLARIVYTCLSVTSSPKPETSPSQSTHRELQLQDLKDTIYFTQPAVYNSFLNGPQMSDEEFRTTALRLLNAEDQQHMAAATSSYALTKSDLQNLIQLLLLLHSEDRLWRRGLSVRDAYQRCGDVHHASLVSAPEETSQASELASALMESHFGSNEDLIHCDDFILWSSNLPAFMFLFFQLWASIFIPPAVASERSHALTGSRSFLPTSVANSLCLMSIASFISGNGEEMYRFHQNELQLQLDLQGSNLVADSVAHCELDGLQLYETITAKNWFHILLVRGEDMDDELNDRMADVKERRTRVLVTVLSPPGDVEMRREEGTRRVEYVWSKSLVQLRPKFSAISWDDSKGMSAHLDPEGQLDLCTHNGRFPGPLNGTNMRLDLRRRLIEVAGQKTTPLKMQLIDLKCYRLPVEASRITSRYESKVSQLVA